jgi:hypothetical protein
MWNVNMDQAAEMYARFCRARYGAKAPDIVEEKVSQLRKAGDREGERVWKQVQRALEMH